MTIRVGIVGGSGYVAAELVGILLNHPEVELTLVTSQSRAGTPIHDTVPHLYGRTDLAYSDLDPVAAAAQVDVLFLAVPHGASMGIVKALMTAGLGETKIIDMSGDFRADDEARFTAAYKTPHSCPEYMPDFVYGLSEWNRNALANAQLVANPGCFATAIGLALAPLAHQGLLAEQVTVFAATGSTGSGAKAKQGTHHPERASNFKLYKILQHQHKEEILVQLEKLGQGTKLSFIPASAPMTHGIFATIHMLTDEPEKVEAAITEAYQNASFVRLRKGSPQMNWVVGSNYADISVTLGDGEVVVVCAIDNMWKGAAGQGVQNMNLMLGWPETLGLGHLPSLP